MKRILTGFASIVAVTLLAIPANAEPLTLTALGGGLVGGTPAGTEIYRADLSSLSASSIQSITITDASFGLGGATGQFSGFDLDAIILSTTLCTTNACAAGLTGISLFDYSPTGTLFSPGAQRIPTDPKLFGTDASGNNVDNAAATLGSFDANSSTVTPFGFISMGDGGKLVFNLTAPVSTSGLYLYLGEVGDNGEVAAGSIEAFERPSSIPEPTSLSLIALGVAALSIMRKKP